MLHTEYGLLQCFYLKSLFLLLCANKVFFNLNLSFCQEPTHWSIQQTTILFKFTQNIYKINNSKVLLFVCKCFHVDKTLGATKYIFYSQDTIIWMIQILLFSFFYWKNEQILFIVFFYSFFSLFAIKLK